MKTKHLFLATALMASFAACTNEDIVFDTPQNVLKDRPTIDNVELDFIGSDIDSRVIYGATGYAWQATDTIGALLMDNVISLAQNKAWLEKYDLVNYVHTSYPFTYSNGVWSSNAKMLEGNYFFAYPWSSYDGNRQVLHTLTAQEQKGIGTNVVAESYGKNQFFIGYSQIMAGVEAKDALENVTMTPILGAVQLRIVNTGTQVRHINKIVLKGNKLASTLTLKPTDAKYVYDETGLTLTEANTLAGEFNYANYTDNLDDVTAWGGTTKVNNATDDYDRNEALRAIVKPVSGETFAQLTITGTAAERELKANAGNTAYALVMANPFKVTTAAEDLKLDIYTDEGVLMNVNLCVVNETAGNYTALTDVAVTEIAPNVSNTIKVQVDDNSFVIPQNMTIYTSEDLKQLIQWNARVAGSRTITATMAKPVTLNKEMINLLNASKHTLAIAPTASETLTLAADVPANALDAKNLNITAPVKVLGSVVITKDSKYGALTIAEGASMTTNDAKVTALNVTNEGTLTIGANAAVATGTIENKGTMTVAKGADVKATTNNYGTLNNNGYVQNVANKKDAVITMGEGAILMTSTNEAEGLIVTANTAQVSLSSNAGEVKYVTGAVVSATGTISVEHTGALTKDTYKSETTGCTISKIIVKQGITSVVATDMAKLTEVEVLNGAELNVTTGTLSVGTLTIEGNATIKGKLSIDALDVKEVAALTIVKDAEITLTANSINNEGIVYNNGKVTAPSDWTDSKMTGEGTWKYNAIQTGTPEVDEDAVAAKLAALWPAVVEYMDLSWTGHEGKYMDKDGYTVVESSVEAWFDAIVSGGALTTAGKPAWIQAGYTNAVAFLEAYTKDATNGYITATELSNALAEIKTANKAAAIKAIEAATGLVKDAKLYATQAAAYTVFKAEASKASSVIGAVATEDANYSVWYAVGGLTDAEIESALAVNNAAMYIWDECVLEKVVAVWKDYATVEIGNGTADYNDAIEAGSGYAALLNSWLGAVEQQKAGDYEEIYNALVTAGYGLKNKDSFVDYTDDQIKAVSTGLLNELELALNNASGTLTLTKDYEITTPLLVNKTITINLNGKTIKGTNTEGHKAVILATAGTLTIKGDGKVEGFTPGTDEISTPAVWAKGTATVNIQGGEFSTKGENSCIYVSSPEARINISGGKFSAEDNSTYVLNQLNSVKKQCIFVSGGTFLNYNPASGDDKAATEGTPASFLAENYKSVRVTGTSNDWTVTANE